MSYNSIPDIQFTVNQCARFTHTLRKSHLEDIKCICRYLKGIHDKCLLFSLTIYLNLNLFVDSHFAGLYHYADE